MGAARLLGWVIAAMLGWAAGHTIVLYSLFTIHGDELLFDLGVLIGGTAAGAAAGALQALALGRRVAPDRWIPASAAGLAVGLLAAFTALSSGVRDTPSRILFSLICGSILGTAQAIGFRGTRVRARLLWIPVTALAFTAARLFQEESGFEMRLLERFAASLGGWDEARRWLWPVEPLVAGAIYGVPTALVLRWLGSPAHDQAPAGAHARAWLRAAAVSAGALGLLVAAAGFARGPIDLPLSTLSDADLPVERYPGMALDGELTARLADEIRAARARPFRLPWTSSFYASNVLALGVLTVPHPGDAAPQEIGGRVVTFWKERTGAPEAFTEADARVEHLRIDPMDKFFFRDPAGLLELRILPTDPDAPGLNPLEREAVEARPGRLVVFLMRWK